MSSGSREQFEALVAQFAKGWEKGDADQMLEVFTPDALFYPSPFDPPARDHAGIRTYWKDIPLEQAEISCRYGEIFVVGPWFATEYKCTFRRRRTGEPVDLRGAMFCETRDEKISEMRLYWHRAVKRSGD
jgi:ketosteroid isomerase-like protein